MIMDKDSGERIDGLSRTLAGRSTRRQALRFTGAGLAGGILAASGASALAKKGKRSGKSGGNGGRRDLEKLYLVTDALSGTSESGATFEGSLYIKKFVVANGELVALAKIDGTLTDGDKTKQVTRGLQIPVASAVMTSEVVGAGRDVSCGVLDLTLGPLDLNLLGLVVHLDAVHLTIDAVPSDGLLGQLLCGLSGDVLLPGVLEGLQGLVDALNDLIGALA